MLYLSGECAELHSQYGVFNHLFMEHEERTNILCKYLDPLLGMFQNFLFFEMVLGICRLLDEDKGKHKNLTLWPLAERASKWDEVFGQEIQSDVELLFDRARLLINHRRKSIAHYDLDVSLEKQELDLVKPIDILECLQQIAVILNKVHVKVTGSEMLYDILDPKEITLNTEYTVAKAAAFDRFIVAGKAGREDWEEFVKTPPSPYHLKVNTAENQS